MVVCCEQASCPEHKRTRECSRVRHWQHTHGSLQTYGQIVPSRGWSLIAHPAWHSDFAHEVLAPVDSVV